MVEQPDSIRLDKWLWAARFFKTRQIAIDAINGGKVHLNGQRTKPGKLVHVGSRLRIHKGELEWDIEIRGISKHRRPASEAALLYEESENSRLHRQERVRERREAGSMAPRPASKPNKRDRRRLQRLIHKPT